MDFTRNEGESERGYYSRVSRELKYGARQGFNHLREYQAGHASIKELEERLKKALNKPSSPAKAEEKAAVEAAPEPAPGAPSESSEVPEPTL